ncbi:MAG: class I SAM-dependent methyltransferase [Pyrinomonadaceae bacterium]
MSAIQADFDRIALLSNEEWNHNSHYHNFLLRHLPQHCLETLEIGCGTGAFSRLLARRSERVLAIDLSPEMIRIAVDRSREFPNIEFMVADARACEFPARRFDCIVTIATLHHLPMREMLSKMKDALKVNGVLLVLDLFQPDGLQDAFKSALALPLSTGLRLIRQHRLRAPREVRRAWAEHERHDSYLTLAQVRELCERVLPQAEVKQHLLWRYSIIWKKLS